MTPWQQSLSQLDEDYILHSNQDNVLQKEPEAAEEEQVVVMAKKTKKKHRSIISKRDVRVLLYLRQVLRSHKKDEETQKRSKTITKLESDKFAPKPNSLSKHFYDLLLPTGKNGLHINDIIEGVERAGYDLQSKYHKYSQVNSALRRHGYMILRIGRARFRLRDGFLNRQPATSSVKQVVVAKSNRIPKLIDIARYVIKECSEFDLTPHKIWYIMNQMGYECSFNYLRSKMREHKIVLKTKKPRHLRTE